MNKNASNSDKISENHIPGINRVVKLDIVIEGKIIKHFKHFSNNCGQKKVFIQ